jgi:peptide/nickel transport system permease protein
MKSGLRILLVFLLVWVIARSAIYFLPGDPAEFLVHESLVKIEPQALREKMDLDRPAVQRIFSLPQNQSLIKNESTLTLLKRAWGRTLILALVSLALALPLTFGLLFLNFQRGSKRAFSNLLTLVLASIPILVLGPILLRTLPFPNPLLPGIVLALYLTAFWYRTLSKRLESQLPGSSVAGARALGFSELKTFTRNLLAPSLGGFIAFFGTQLGFLLNGSLLVETIFQWNGIGSLLADAVLSRDYPIIEVGMMTAALLTLLAQQAGYAFQTWWDPRIK